ncbi:unknown [Prevotella sp. CAG:1092]|nr:unknown [Prevotella sp. CAG:1092]
MKTCLEQRSMEERHKEQVRSDYNRENQYNVTHPDALANGDAQGKGTGFGGHSFWLPNCSGSLNMINYSNFDTGISSGAGNNTDNEMRNKALARSLYNQENVYSAKLVDTSENVREGQYQTR